MVRANTYFIDQKLRACKIQILRRHKLTAKRFTFEAFDRSISRFKCTENMKRNSALIPKTERKFASCADFKPPSPPPREENIAPFGPVSGV